MSKTTAVLMFTAALLGGVLSRYIAPQPVNAETFPNELRAQSFVLVNQQGTVLGTFSQEDGRPVLRLYDGSRREIWSAGGKVTTASVLGK